MSPATQRRLHSVDVPSPREEVACPDCVDGLGAATPVEHGSVRDRIRSRPGLAQAWRIGVFVAGLLCVAVGIALAVLPGPLTIPPVLLGLWIWSSEFRWAERFFDTSRDKARAAWAHARRHPVSSTAITVGGLVLVGVAVWVVRHYGLAERARDLVGL